MSKISIALTSVLNMDGKLKSAKSLIDNASSDINYILRETDSKIKNRNNINAKFNEITSSLSAISQRISRISATIENAITQYDETEKEIARKKASWNVTVVKQQITQNSTAFVSSLPKNGNGSSSSLNTSTGSAEKLDDMSSPIKFENKLKFTAGDDSALNEAIFGKNEIKQNKKEKDLAKSGKDTDWHDKSFTFGEAKAKNSVDVSVWDADTDGNLSWAQGSASAAALNAGAFAEAYAGFYQYEYDKNGKETKKISPAVGASVGGSVSVFEAEVDGRIGLGKDNNMLGIYGKAETQVLEAEAKAGAEISKDQTYIGASAEANLIEIEGALGASVLGTDVGVTGGVKVGVGAEFQVGMVDGVFKAEVGAAFGVGVSVGIEVDIGGTVDAVVDAAESVVDWFSGLF